MWWIGLLACTGDTPPDAPFVPAGRSGSVAFVDDDGLTLRIAGGRTDSGVSDDTLALDLDTLAWTAGPPAGEPLYRTGGAASGDGAVVFGGTSRFDQESELTWHWRPGDDVPWIAGGSGPPARAWHATTWGDGQLWVHGGRQDDGDVVVFDDLWAYDPTVQVWTEHAVPAGGPTARYRHGLAWLDGDLWVHGGLDAAGDRHNALWRLDQTAGRWVAQELGQSAPAARASHNLAALDGVLWLWGGDPTDTRVWTRGPQDPGWTPHDTEDAPAAREDAAVAALPDESGLLLFGGDREVDGPGNDIWAWDGTTSTWSSLVPASED